MNLSSSGLFDVVRQSPREVLHLVLYNVVRPFANGVLVRYLTPEGQEEFGYRQKALKLPRDWAPINFNMTVLFEFLCVCLW